MTSGRHHVARRGTASRRAPRRLTGLFAAASVGLVGLTLAVIPLPGSADASTSQAASTSTLTKTVDATRTHLVGGADVVADQRSVKVTVDVTTGLRNQQPVNVSWSGAHPTGGIALDPNGSLAASLEYPLVILECRGVESGAAAAERISPETCYTQTPNQRYYSTNDAWAPFRLDRYATPAERTATAGVPSPLPAACAGSLSGLDHWVPFKAVDGTTYAGGPSGCAGMAPEATSEESSVPPNTTFARTDLSGNGTAKFVITTEDSNASLGCSYKVACALVVVPIMGISCDASAAALPAADQPPKKYTAFLQQRCATTGNYDPTVPHPVVAGDEDPAVTGRVWWSASNWRNHVSFPLAFAKPDSVCGVVNSGAPQLLYGSEALRQATLQWGPAFCTDPKLFTFRHVSTSEPQAKNLVDAGTINAAIAAAPPSQAFTRPIVQAPVALSGFAVVFTIDGASGEPVTTLRLNARLLAKLMTQSYSGNQTISVEYKALSKNPLALPFDPEFKALNPEPINDAFATDPASVLFTVSSDSDVMHALTSYINVDPEARAFLDGSPDPWGMVVNPSFKGISLPVDGWPQLDTFVSPYLTSVNPCLTVNPVPWLPLVAAPVSDPAVVATNMQYGIANSQVICKNAGENNQKLVAMGRQAPGKRFLVGVVSLGDAERYQINIAALQTYSMASASAKFSDGAGRTFVAPTQPALDAAANLLTRDVGRGTWVVPYDIFRSDKGKSAYPGLLLVSLDVPTKGLSTKDATQLSTFVRWAATTGQAPGPDNGQLPPGYLPFGTAAIGAQLASYATSAAAAIAAQQGYVPAVDGSGHPPSPSPTATPAPTPLPTTGSPDQGGGFTPTPSTTTSTSASAAGPTPSPSSTALIVVAAARTAYVPAGAAGQAIPVLLGLALLTGLAAIISSIWGRR